MTGFDELKRNAGMDASQVVTCKALSLACWRITGEASSIGVPLRFFEHELNELNEFHESGRPLTA
jgi:hypothetical protein